MGKKAYPPIRKKTVNRGGKSYTCATAYINGKTHTLGQYGSAAAERKYRQLTSAAGRANDLRPTDRPAIVKEIAVRYTEHAKTYYRDRDGQLTTEYDNAQRVMR